MILYKLDIILHNTILYKYIYLMDFAILHVDKLPLVKFSFICKALFISELVHF